jgi:MoaA/NifB/PqqE/SkfB family radical SAM enzyme
MNLKTFKKLIDETEDYVFLLLLWGWGEPFMNPNVYEMIAYAKSKGIQSISSTNGHPFSRRRNAEKVVRSGMDSLIFAVDGISQQTYQLYRQGGDLEKVVEGIRNVVETKESLGSVTPLINLRFIVMKHNEHEIGEPEKFANVPN